ncbi:MAG: SGNH/GDSL hydrolase family protein [Clostridia bacterium]
MLFSKDQKILFMGDSISDFDRTRPVGEGLFNAWGTSYVAMIGASLGSMYPELQLRVVNMGISGNNVVDLRKRWQTDALDKNPDWVCVLIGINDVWRQFDCPAMHETHVHLQEYTETYDALIAQTLPHVKCMVLMTPYFMEPNREDPMRKEMDRYGAVVRALSEKYHTAFVDLQSAWDALFEHMHPCNIAWDRIHPNQTGHMLIARTFLQAVGFDR